MNSSKVKTQKTLSAILGAALAVITLFQAANVEAHKADFVSVDEAALQAELDELLMEEMILLEELEEATESVKVYNQDNELIGEGNPASNPLLNKLVNQADYLSEMGGEKYYKISE